MSERAKYIPLRLEQKERLLLRLMEGVLNVIEYTDRVDDAALSSHPAKRRQMMLKEIHSCFAGVLLACCFI